MVETIEIGFVEVKKQLCQHEEGDHSDIYIG